MKKFLSIILLVITFLSFSVVVYANDNIPEYTEYYINDFADIFSEDEEAYIYNKSLQMNNDFDGMQICVTTIKTTNGQDINSYATDMYNKYGIGKDSRGVLIVIATEDRNICLRTGDGIRQKLNDSKADSLITSYAIPYLKNNNFPKGVLSLYDATYDYLEEAYSLKQEDNVSNPIVNSNKTENVHESTTKEKVFGISTVILLIAFLICIYIACGNYLKANQYKDKIDELTEKDKMIRDEESERYNQIVKERNAYKKKYEEEKIKYSQLKADWDIANSLAGGNLIYEVQDKKEENEFENDVKTLKLIKNNILLKDVNVSSLNKSECNCIIGDKSQVENISYKFNRYLNNPKFNERASEIYNDDTKSLIDKYFILCEKVNNRIHELKELEYERDAREFERKMEEAKRRHSKYATKEICRDYDSLNKNVKRYIAHNYIMMYENMQNALHHPTRHNDFFPAEVEHNNYSSDNLSSPSTFTSFGGHSSGGGASHGF